MNETKQKVKKTANDLQIKQLQKRVDELVIELSKTNLRLKAWIKYNQSRGRGAEFNV